MDENTEDEEAEDKKKKKKPSRKKKKNLEVHDEQIIQPDDLPEGVTRLPPSLKINRL